MSLPPPTEPLEYASPAPTRRRPLIDVPLAFSCLSAAIAVTVVLFIVVPRAEETFKTFGTKLPTSTILLLNFSRFCQSGGIAFVWILFALPPIIVPLVRPWPPPDSRRRYFRLSRLLLTVFLMFFFGWMILALFQPYVALIDAVSNSPK
ncbi:MAG: hypothetical protein JWN40_4267 [Phycisphaerales bacterium]|nr:hypothetical protein [Phycisphaerales bacterium]